MIRDKKVPLIIRLLLWKLSSQLQFEALHIITLVILILHGVCRLRLEDLNDAQVLLLFKFATYGMLVSYGHGAFRSLRVDLELLTHLHLHIAHRSLEVLLALHLLLNVPAAGIPF